MKDSKVSAWGIGAIIAAFLAIPFTSYIVTGSYTTGIWILIAMVVFLWVIPALVQNQKAQKESKKEETVYDRQLKFELNHLEELVKEGSITQETAEQRKKSLIERYNS